MTFVKGKSLPNFAEIGWWEPLSGGTWASHLPINLFIVEAMYDATHRSCDCLMLAVQVNFTQPLSYCVAQEVRILGRAAAKAHLAHQTVLLPDLVFCCLFLIVTRSINSLSCTLLNPVSVIHSFQIIRSNRVNVCVRSTRKSSPQRVNF